MNTHVPAGHPNGAAVSARPEFHKAVAGVSNAQRANKRQLFDVWGAVRVSLLVRGLLPARQLNRRSMDDISYPTEG